MLENADSIQASAADDLFYSINGIFGSDESRFADGAYFMTDSQSYFGCLILNNLVYNNYCI